MTTGVKGHLRAAHRADPDEFERLVREYMEQGPGVFDASAPGTNAGRPKQIGRDNYALLYVRVMRLQRDEGLSETAALKTIAGNADYWSNPSTGYVGTIESVSAARKHLAEAKARYDNEPDFRDRVEFLRWAWDLIT